MAWTIVTSPDASVLEKVVAGGYMVVEGAAHATVAVGTAVIGAETAPATVSYITSATATKTLAGSGAGAIVSGGTYLATNAATGKPFDSTDFLLATSSGAIEGGFAANFGPVSSSLFSGIAAGGQSIASDHLHNRPIDYSNAGANVFTGITSSMIAEGLTGGFNGWGKGARNASYGIRGEAEFIDRTWLHQNPYFLPKTSSQAAARTVLRDIFYGTGINVAIDEVSN